MAEHAFLLDMTGISKGFPGVIALREAKTARASRP
jgi:ABC-type sugar transport system ATPase subunit